METFLSDHCGDDEDVAGDRGKNNSAENQTGDDTMFERDENRTAVVGRGPRRAEQLRGTAAAVQREEGRNENIAEDDRRAIQVTEVAIETREIVGEKTVHRIDEHRDE